MSEKKKKEKHPKVVRIDQETDEEGKRDGMACARQFHEKKKSYVTLVFLSKSHTTLRMTMYLVFEKTPFLLSQVRFHEAIAP